MRPDTCRKAAEHRASEVATQRTQLRHERRCAAAETCRRSGPTSSADGRAGRARPSRPRKDGGEPRRRARPRRREVFEGGQQGHASLCDKAERLAGGSLAGVDRLGPRVRVDGRRRPRGRRGPAATKKAAFTPQQVEAVKKVIAAKRRGHYAVLGIERPRLRSNQAGLPQLLKFHPDKTVRPTPTRL